MMQELKPCPFCGSSNLARSVDGGILPDFIDSARFDYREKPYYITCTLTCDDCGAMLQGYTATSKHEDCDPDDAIEDAYSKWNTRAERTCANVWDKEPEPKCDNGFKCSLCGYSVSDGEDWRVFTHEHEENDCAPWRYCPGCGAKVVDE